MRKKHVSVSGRFFALCVVVAGALGCTGCAQRYVTPGARADFSAFGLSQGQVESMTDHSVQQELDKQPLATFPATIAVVRVQAPGYSSYHVRSRGEGAYSVVTQRTVEHDADMERLRRLPMVSGVATINGLLVPDRLSSDRELRQAAASVHADLLLLYTFDTSFSVNDTAVAPLGFFTLGIFPSREAEVSTTVSALLMDTRNGYIYGLAEASAKDDQLANAWTSDEAVDQTRRRVEREGFQTLIDDFQRAWTEVLVQYARR